MTTPTAKDDLVERLRGIYQGRDTGYPLAREAADEIVRLNMHVAVVEDNYNRVLEQSGERETAARAEGFAAAIEMAAKALEISNQGILLMAGEMGAQELRSVHAVLRSRAGYIRALRLQDDKP